MRAVARLRSAALALLVVLISLSPLKADPIAAIQAAAVAVAVKGVRNADSAPVEAHGSGFFTSQDGYLVTSYHLVSDLLAKGVDERTLTYTITVEGLSAHAPLEAVVAWKNDTVDLMVLRARIGSLKIRPLQPDFAARNEIRLTETPVFTGGYPGGYEFVVDKGYVKAFEGPADAAVPAWVTNMTFKEGQSGSPVVTEDGRVVAVVKAIDLDAASIGILVPIRDIPLNYWQSTDAEQAAPAADRSLRGIFPHPAHKAVPDSMNAAAIQSGPNFMASLTAERIAQKALAPRSDGGEPTSWRRLALPLIWIAFAATFLLVRKRRHGSARHRSLPRQLRLFFKAAGKRWRARSGPRHPPEKCVQMEDYFQPPRHDV